MTMQTFRPPGKSFSFREKLLFFVVALFLLLGNSLRILPIATSFGNVNFGEIVVYFVAFLLFPRIVLEIFSSTLARTIILGTVLSIAVGIVKWGAELSAISYSARLIAQVMLAWVLGQVLVRKRSTAIDPALDTYLLIYFGVAIAALVLFVMFPEADVLWAALATVGVEFQGDPHIGRLISLYFDPNFYAAIIVLPVVIAAHCYAATSNKKYLVCAFVLASTLFLTVSRSGIALLVMIGLAYSAGGTRKIFNFRLSRRALKTFVLLFVIGLITIAVSYQQVDRLLDRFAGGVQDDSSTARLDSFLVGARLFEKEVLFGYGYNFALPYIQESGRLGLDSSLQMVLLSYGLVPALVISIIVVVQMIMIDRRLRRLLQQSPLASAPLFRLWRLFLVYIVLSLVWASNFNQILFYPFWIVPVFGFLFYFEQLSRLRLVRR